MTDPEIEHQASERNGAPHALLGALALTYLLTTTDSQMMPPLLPAIGEALGETERLTRLVAVFGVTASVTSVMVGGLIDRFGSARVLPFGFCAFALAEVVAANSPSYGMLLAARTIAGAGAATLSLSMMIRINEVFPARRRGWAFGIFAAGGAGSAVIGLPAVAWLQRYSWHAPFALFAPLALVLGVTAIYFSRSQASPPVRESGGEQNPRHPAQDFWRDLLANPRMMVVLSLGLVFNMGIFAMLTVFGLWCAEELGLSTGQIFVYYVGAGIAGIISGPISGRLANRFGVVQVMTFATILLSFLLAAIPFARRPAPLFVLFFLASAFNISRLVPYHVLTLQTAGPGVQARFTGLRNAVSQFGIFAGAGASGLIYEKLPWGYAGSGVFASITCLIALIELNWLLRKPSALSPLG